MIQTFFNNIETNIVRTIASAENRIYVAVAWFTNQVLFDALIDALRKNIEVKVVILNDLVNRNELGLDFGILIEKGADVKMALSNKGLMHHKFCIIDNKVITGSYNWTYRGNINNENIVIIDEPDIANIYCEQFNTIFSIADIINLPYKRLEWTDVKEEDYSKFHNNIFLDIEAQSNPNKELRQNKLKKLNVAFKSGNAEELAAASSLPISEPIRTIKDVLTSRSQCFKLKLWKVVNKVYNPDEVSVCKYKFISVCKYKFIDFEINNEDSPDENIKGILFEYDKIKKTVMHKKNGFEITIYDKPFIKTIKRYIKNDKSYGKFKFKDIPEEILCIEKACSFNYKFASPMYKINQPKTKDDNTPRLIAGIKLFAIVKEFNEDNIIYNNGQMIVLKVLNYDNIMFYEGWDPNEKGKLIQEKFFTKS